MVKKIINVLSTVFLVVLVLLVILMFIIRLSGNSPSVFGYHVYRVASDSMEPTLKVGDVILVGPVDAEKIQKDDIITYKALQGELAGHEITHRVVTEPVKERGRYYYQTQGDADGAPLDPRISYDQVVGKYITKLFLISLLYSFFFKPYGLIAFVLLIFILFGYEMVSLFTSYKSLDKITLEDVVSDQEKPQEEESKMDSEQKEESES